MLCTHIVQVWLEYLQIWFVMLLWWSVPLPFEYGVQHKEVGKFLEMWNFINSNKCFVYVSIVYTI